LFGRSNLDKYFFKKNYRKIMNILQAHSKLIKKQTSLPENFKNNGVEVSTKPLMEKITQKAKKNWEEDLISSSEWKTKEIETKNREWKKQNTKRWKDNDTAFSSKG
jgi:hypothetical protein